MKCVWCFSMNSSWRNILKPEMAYSSAAELCCPWTTVSMHLTVHVVFCLCMTSEHKIAQRSTAVWKVTHCMGLFNGLTVHELDSNTSYILYTRNLKSFDWIFLLVPKRGHRSDSFSYHRVDQVYFLFMLQAKEWIEGKLHGQGFCHFFLMYPKYTKEILGHSRYSTNPYWMVLSNFRPNQCGI